MNALLLAIIAGAALLIAYFTYGRWVAGRVFGLREDASTPAVSLRDDRDYCPTRKSIVFGHHFTSIAGTGPIVGPAIAVMWGWLPAVLWVLIGSIFIGAVHDLGSLAVSLRNKGRSVGDIAGDLLGPRVRMIFLCILVMALWIVLAIFGLVIAAVLRQYPGAIFPVIVQIPLAVIIGLTAHRKGAGILLPSAIALGVMYLSVIYGDTGFLHDFNTFLASQPTWLWVVGLLLYAYIASVLPVWTLLQPRDYINALQLITALGLLVIGLIGAATVGGVGDVITGADGAREVERLPLEIVAPTVNTDPEGAPPMIPILFITIACGAISGFHCLVASGTTSKQMARETDAHAVGYGGMLLEGFLATLVIVSCAAGLGLGIDVGRNTSVAGGSDFWLHAVPSSGPNVGDAVLFNARVREAGDAPTPYPIQGPTVDIYGNMPFEVNQKGFGNPRSFHAWGYPNGWFDIPHGEARIQPGRDSLEIRGPVAFETRYASWSAAGSLGAKVGAFVDGSANLIKSLMIPGHIAVALMGVLVASFAGTTMDTACRLQRYVVQELSRTFLPTAPDYACPGCGYDLSNLDRGIDAGLTCPECGDAAPPVKGSGGVQAERALASGLNPFKWLSTVHGATLFAVITAALLAAVPAPGQPVTLANAGKGGLILWPLFGATNQLLGGLAFLVIGAWLIARKRPWWFLILPTALMIVLPAWALIWQAFVGDEANPSWLADQKWLLVVIAALTLLLEAWLVVEVALRLFGGGGGVDLDEDRGLGGPDPSSCSGC